MQFHDTELILKLQRKYWYLLWFGLVLPFVLFVVLMIILVGIDFYGILVYATVLIIPLSVCIVIYEKQGGIIIDKLHSMGADVSIRYPRRPKK